MECTGTYHISPHRIAFAKLRPNMRLNVPPIAMMNFIVISLTIAFFSTAIGVEISSAQEVKAAQSWPHLIPCRIHDGVNPDMFVMTLGDIDTPIADGIFDPVKDSVLLKDGTVKANYY